MHPAHPQRVHELCPSHPPYEQQPVEDEYVREVVTWNSCKDGVVLAWASARALVKLHAASDNLQDFGANCAEEEECGGREKKEDEG